MMKRMLLIMLVLPLFMIPGMAKPAHAGPDCFLGEVMMFGGNFAPRGWLFLDGQLLSISQNQSLFAILGTTYGGDGRTSFALPDLRGRVAIHPGQGPGLTPRNPGESGGTETETLDEIPSHTHTLEASTNAPASTDPMGRVLGQPVSAEIYSTVNETPAEEEMSPAAIGVTGQNQGHNNTQPSRVLNYIICLQGVFPSRN